MLYSLTIKEASDKLAKGEISSVELTESVFERLSAVEPLVGAYITLCKDKAIEMARESDKRYAISPASPAGRHKRISPIDGIPVAVKDVILTKNIKTTAASKILEDFVPPYNATVYEKLEKAGAVLIGKTNLDEFAMGSSTENSALKKTDNPKAPGHVPGGSSGGSAAAVAADECIFALGTDTGGSIRQPASFCGVTGMKVSYGLVSRYGVISYASSFDTIGPLTKSVEDAAIVLQAIGGNDPKDSTTTQKKSAELPNYFESLDKNLKGKKIGIPEEYFGEGTSGEVADVVKNDAIKVLQSLGAEIVPVSLPMTKYAIAAYYILVKSEASSNLSRYDGIHYGHSPLKCHPELVSGSLDSGSLASVRNDKVTLEEVYSLSRTEGFGPEAKRSIMLGTYTLSAGYYDAYYKKAAKIRTLIKKEYDDIFKKVDVLIAPASPFPAFPFGSKMDDPLAMYLADVDTVSANVAGIPAISIPAGFTKDNLPVGLQIIGPMWGEQAILNVGYAFQTETDWHLKKPKI